MRKLIEIVIYILVIIGLIVNAYFMLENGEPDKFWWWAVGAVFFVWTATPFIIVAVINKFLAKDVASKAVLLITVAVITLGGGYILIEAFITHLDAQSGLVLIFLPFYQCFAVAIGVVPIIVIRLLRNRKSSMSEKV